MVYTELKPNAEKEENVKSIEVVAAIIKQNGKIFAAQRGYGDLQGEWEFPGGKIEPGESREEALKREIREELGANIVINSFLTTVVYPYETFELTMHCFICHLEEGSHATLLEHEDARWLTSETLGEVDWLPADVEVIEEIKRQRIV